MSPTAYKKEIVEVKTIQLPISLILTIFTCITSGATIIGSPPVKSPSLSDYPKCDEKVLSLAKKIWGTLETPKEITSR
jgi:hypothetical protein